MKLVDCMTRAKRLPPDVKRALVRKTEALAEEKGIDTTTAAREIVTDLRKQIREDIAKVNGALKAQPESEHVMGVTAGERVRATETEPMSEPEKAVVENSLELALDEAKVPEAERPALRKQYQEDLAADYASTKARNPTSEEVLDPPWRDGLKAIGVKLVKPPKGDRKKAYVVWQKMPYTFDEAAPGQPVGNDPTPQRGKLRDDLAGKLVEEVSGIVERAKAGDKAARKQLRQRYWYANVVSLLRRWQGGFSDAFADLLGAFSPKTDVNLNWRYAVDALRKLMRGDYDATMQQFSDWLDSGQTADAYRKAGHPMIVQENRALFGMNSLGAMKAMLDLWRMTKKGDAPKARNFAKNLIGLSFKATIDVWAARGMQRLARDLAKEQSRAYAHLERIPAIAEGKVEGDHLDAERVGGAFGFAQDVFDVAAARLRQEEPKLFRDLTAADLQALLWFREKEIWSQNRWSFKEGGSIEANIDVQQAGRYYAGISQQRSGRPGQPDFIPTTVEQGNVAEPLQGILARLPGVLAARVKDTWGRFVGSDERSFDLEVLTDPTVDPWDLIRHLARVGAEHDQDNVFISRVLDVNEENPNWRPGMEVYFKDVVPESMVQPIMDLLRKHDIDGFTLVVDPRTKPEGTLPPGRFRGIRMQYVPEFRGEEYSEAKMEAKQKELVRFRNAISKLPGVARVGVLAYDTLVLNRNDYDNLEVPQRDAEGSPAGVWARRSSDEATRRADQSRRASRAHNLPAIYPGEQASPGGRLKASRVLPAPSADTTGVDAMAAEAVAESLRARMPGGPKVVVYATGRQAAAQYEGDTQTAGDILSQRPEAFYDPLTDTVVLIAEHFAPEAGEAFDHYVTRKILHEAAGHGGLSRLFIGGPLESEYSSMMRAAYRFLRDQDFGTAWYQRHGYRSLQELADAYGFDLESAEGVAATIEEHLSRMAEDPTAPKWFDTFVTEVTRLLRRLGLAAWTEADTRMLLLRARDQVGLDRIERTRESALKFSKQLSDASGSPEKQRGFITSIKENQAIAPEVRDKVAGVYEPIENKATQAEAARIIDEEGIDVSLTRFMGQRHPTALDYAIGIDLMGRLQAAQRYDESVDLAEHMAERATGQGQAIQQLSALSKFTREGIQVYAARLLDKTIASNPELKEAQAAIKRLKDQLKRARRRVAERAVVKGKAGNVAEKIYRHMIAAAAKGSKGAKGEKSIWGRYKDSAINELAGKLLGPNRPRDIPALEAFTRRLTRNLREQLPKGELRGVEGQPRPGSIDEAAMLGEAVRNFGKYQEVWQEAQRHVQEMFKDHPEALESLDQYFGQILERPFSQKSVERAVRQVMKETNLQMREILFASGADKKAARDKLTQVITSRAGVEGAEAASIAQAVQAEYERGIQKERDALLKSLAPRVTGEQKAELTKLIERNNAGMLDDSRFFSYLAKTYGLTVWSPELSIKVQEAQRDYEAVDASKTPELKLAKAAEMFDLIHDALPKDSIARIASLQNIAMLLNGRTVIRNVIGNAILFAADMPADAVSAWVVDPFLSIFTGERVRTSVEVGARLKGLARPIEDFWEGYKFAKDKGAEQAASLKAGVQNLLTLGRLTSRGSYSVSDLNTKAAHVFSSRMGRLLEDGLTLVLAPADRAFYNAAFQGSLARQRTLAKRNGEELIADTQEMIDLALAEAARAIYQDPNMVSKLLAGMRRAANFNQAWGVGSMLFTFVQVPGSMLVRGAQWSPLGMINVLYELAVRPVAKGERIRQRELGDALVRAALGTGAIALTGFWLASLGILSGPGDEDDDLEAFRRASGLGKYRINISALKRATLSGNFWTPQKPQAGDLTINYDWAQPLAMPLAMGAEYHRMGERRAQAEARGEKSDDIWWLKDTLAATQAAVGTLAEQPLFTGLTRWAANMRAPDSNVISATMNTVIESPKMFVPALIKQVNDAMSNQAREVRAGDKIARTWDEIASSLPGVSLKYPPRYDVFGQAQQKYEYGGNNFFNVFFNPTTIRIVKDNPAVREMEAVYKATAQGELLPRRVKVTMPFKGLKVELTNEQISEYQRDLGEATVRMYTRLAASPEFARASAFAKAQEISRQLTMVNEIAKVRAIRRDPGLKQAFREDLQEKAGVQRNLMRMPAPAMGP